MKCVLILGEDDHVLDMTDDLTKKQEKKQGTECASTAGCRIEQKERLNFLEKADIASKEIIDYLKMHELTFEQAKEICRDYVCDKLDEMQEKQHL